jgi:RNA polymerase sigma-70 factor, ECF subfamily
MSSAARAQRDIELITSVANGSVEAYESLVERYQTRVYNMAMRLTRNPFDAEEVLQEVFVTLFQKAGSFEGRCAFTSWLYRIVYNTSLMHLRRKHIRLTGYLEDENAYETHEALQAEVTENTYQQKELRGAIARAFEKMPEHYRDVFVMRDVEGFSNEQTGEFLGMSVAGVKSKLHRARAILRRHLQRYWIEFSGEDRRVALAA